MPKRYTILKTARFFISLGIVVFINFSIPRMMPGSPVNALLGSDSIGLSDKDYEALEEEMGLNRPLFLQFITHVKEIFRLDLGFSYFYHQPVSKVVGEHLAPTLLLLFPSVLLSSILAVLFGVIAGRFPGKIFDLISTAIILLAYAMPTFLIAMMGLTIFGYHLAIFPLGGLKSIDAKMEMIPSIFDTIWHLMLPVMILSCSSIAPKFLIMRNSVVENMDQDYVVYAKARGISEFRILFVHILKKVSLPVISLVGIHFAYILSGSLLVEIVFSINGMGSLIHEAAVNRDYPMLQGCFFLLTVVALSVNHVVDLSYGFLDHRVSA